MRETPDIGAPLAEGQPVERGEGDRPDQRMIQQVPATRKVCTPFAVFAHSWESLAAQFEREKAGVQQVRDYLGANQEQQRSDKWQRPPPCGSPAAAEEIPGSRK
ncbi:MAG TPA: hypothetical protein VFA32_03805 [Dehalococcoidia bacterium]|nr:hypothetical protein [Dehalococcoidia bacterium]